MKQIEMSRPPMPSRRHLLTALAALPVIAALPRSAAAQGLPKIVATTGMIADAARQLVGPAAEVQGLMGPGIDPHGWRPTRSDMLALTRADVVLWHGLHLEQPLMELMEQLAKTKPVIAVAETVPQADRLAFPDYPDRPDPHVWMDPKLWSLVVTHTAGALAEALPALPRADLDAALAAYQGQITALDSYARGVLDSVPPAARVLVTAHDAFGYFGRAYGFEVEGVQGISTESEAGLARMGELVDLMVERRVGAVFVESSVPDRAMRALVEGAAARGWQVAIGGELYSDAMGTPGSYEGTWIGMIDHNVTTIARALGGTVPERGMSGALEATQ